jgi:hypothetical protein
MARWSLAAFQFRCLGTAGGCAGLVIGGLIGLWLAAALTHSWIALIPGLFGGAMIGTFVGMWVALKLMAR